MAKPGARSTSTPNVANNRGSGAGGPNTHPDTRVVTTFPNQQGGTVVPTMTPLPSIADMESRRQKPKNDDQPCSITNLPTNESNASSLQVPLDPAARVDTKRTYNEKG